MRYLCIFIFTLGNGQQFKIISRSMRQAKKTLKLLTLQANTVTHIEIRIRISLNPITYAKHQS